MKSFSNRITDAFKKKDPGFEEVFTLLNFEEYPTALIDAQLRTILFINSKLMKLVSYSRQDVWQKEGSFLLPDLELSSAFSGEIRQVTLNRHDLEPIQVRIRFDFLDSAGRWIAIKFLPGMANEEERRLVLEQTYARLAEIARLNESADTGEGMSRGIAVIQEIVGCEGVCLYQADSSLPQLKRVAVTGTAEDLPEVLPSTDLVRQDSPSIWVSGNRILTEIQRAARVAKIEYVGTAPLNQGGGAFGILVVVGKGIPPVNLSIEILDLLATLLLSLFQGQILVKNLNEKIEKSNTLLRIRNSIFDNINEAIVVLNKNLEIQEINLAAEWLLGYSAQEAKGQAYENILIGTDRLLPALIEAQKGKSTLNIGKASLNRRNGQTFPVEMKVIPVDYEGVVSAIEILMTDISEHEQSKAVTQQLEHRAVLGDYTAAFAHDVRNPINNIATGLQLLSATLQADNQSQDVINRVLGDCTRLNHLMESFLAFSRPLELKVETFAVEPFLKRIIDRWQPRLARVNVKPVLYVDRDDIYIVGDARSLENVFTNLISNALEAMTDSGDTLAIKTAYINAIDDHPMVEISVSDNGPGIPQDIKDHIFEPFITTRKLGTGLGLAITKQIVNAHKGSITVNSFPGGTVFTVQLPAEIGEKK